MCTTVISVLSITSTNSVITVEVFCLGLYCGQLSLSVVLKDIFSLHQNAFISGTLACISL